ncbi:hypothetical protein TSUD_218960 [Trifolium subterraneum]|uniref:Uncharacterized protein n=1 Tax=Trifolium subterraneum TaxID=3900 RepID=A0A2Z6NRP5_TRISU|nr:hypothetical protein TSUD_218960 [Trifolium subterraneum]
MMETSTSAFAYNTVPPHPLPTFRSFRCSVSNAAVAASVISILQTPVHRLCEGE